MNQGKRNVRIRHESFIMTDFSDPYLFVVRLSVGSSTTTNIIPSIPSAMDKVSFNSACAAAGQVHFALSKL